MAGSVAKELEDIAVDLPRAVRSGHGAGEDACTDSQARGYRHRPEDRGGGNARLATRPLLDGADGTIGHLYPSAVC
jgi:hypothetical protein